MEETLNAIRNGEVDAIIVSGSNGEKIFSLGSAETPYRIILEQMNEGAATLTSEGMILYCNKAFANLLSLPIEKIIGSGIYNYMFEGEIKKFERILARGIRGRSKGDIAFRLKKDRVIHLNISIRALSSEIDADVCIIASDITQEKKYQLHLEDLVKKRTEAIEEANKMLMEDIFQIQKAKQEISEAGAKAITEKIRLETIMDTLPVGVAIINIEGATLRSNRLFTSILGNPGTFSLPHHYFPEPRWAATNKPVQPGEWAWTSAIKNGKTVTNQQLTIRKSNGMTAFILNSAAPLVGSTGEIEGCVIVIQDITLLKTTENELKEAQERLEVALENGNIGIWGWDISTNEMFWDKRMKKILSLDKGNSAQTFSTFENCINEEDLNHFRKALIETLKSGIQFETVVRTRPFNGESNYISLKALVNKDTRGKPASLSGVCFDVTEMKRGAEKVLIKLNEELLRSNKDLEQFAYVASHDLQEPLRMVSFFSQKLGDAYRDKLDQDAQDYIKFAVDGSKRMFNLINGLLEYSRVQTKGKKFGQVDMNDVVRKVINNLKLKIKEKNAVVNIITENLPVIFADESQMVQLMQNLVTNAVKFSRGTPLIEISAISSEDKYIFSIKDNGIGIEPQYYERIFKMFQRLVRTDEYEGIGVGLAICKRIIERHEGEIWVESEAGKETTFFFSIPKAGEKE